MTWLVHVCAMTHSYMCAMTHSYVCHESFICVLWLVHMCATTHSCACYHAPHKLPLPAWHDSFICVTWLHSCVWHDSFICVPGLFAWAAASCVTWLIHMCPMTHSYMCALTHSDVCHESIICVPWLIHICAMTHHTNSHFVRDMTHSCVTHGCIVCVTWLLHVKEESFVCVTGLTHICAKTHSQSKGATERTAASCVMWLIHVCGVTYPYVWHDLFARTAASCVTWLTHMYDITHLYVCHDAFICVPMTHSHEQPLPAWREAFMNVTWLIHRGARCAAILHTCVMKYSYVWYDLFVCVAKSLIEQELSSLHRHITHLHHDSFIHINAGQKSFVRANDPLICATWLIHRARAEARCTGIVRKPYLMHVCVTWLICIRDMTHSHVVTSLRMCNMTHSCVWNDSFIHDHSTHLRHLRAK